MTKDESKIEIRKKFFHQIAVNMKNYFYYITMESKEHLDKCCQTHIDLEDQCKKYCDQIDASETDEEFEKILSQVTRD